MTFSFQLIMLFCHGGGEVKKLMTFLAGRVESVKEKRVNINRLLFGCRAFFSRGEEELTEGKI
jgi:hypothetical protein